jgi:hypothetical protein
MLDLMGYIFSVSRSPERLDALTKRHEFSHGDTVMNREIPDEDELNRPGTDHLNQFAFLMHIKGIE